MKIPVIVRLTVGDKKYHDVNAEATASELINGEELTVSIPAGTFTESTPVYGFQIIAGPGEILAARKMLFNPFHLDSNISWTLTCKVTISINE